jgi:hypothetical protein
MPNQQNYRPRTWCATANFRDGSEARFYGVSRSAALAALRAYLRVRTGDEPEHVRDVACTCTRHR